MVVSCGGNYALRLKEIIWGVVPSEADAAANGVGTGRCGCRFVKAPARFSSLSGREARCCTEFQD
jgi:hypothetical protein